MREEGRVQGQHAIAPHSGVQTGNPVSAEDGSRAGLYRLLATLFSGAPDADLLQQISTAEGDGTKLGRAVTALAAAARDTTPQAAAAEFEAVFIGVVEGEVVPYASHYLTGFLYDRPLAHLRDDLDRLGLARADGVAEPEDGIASLCELMAVLIDGSLGAMANSDEQHVVFETHIAPWVAQFCVDLEASPSAGFYKSVAGLARIFFDVEHEVISLEN
jgi:TorA maturation chaperone TorD